MKILLRKAGQEKRQFLIDELLKFGIYKKNNKHLYEWNLCELEKEYHYIVTNDLVEKRKNNLVMR
ncbi:Fur-regulated basic protein FbpA [Bacillus salipaludis]|uniref:Fur-regulated basic protein FbpA n=1 Tax=Bacillus salipaludis TaxID=2547811 RepID=A0A4R5VV35_9BACI|nr:Fur-regulated basic protein FbpA [Bacillus salipaludis]TDK63049.1 Fur-regulated basic protein FbpA [Bacillus salipaludis]